jgi:phenylacetic acid degradation operon negative regulatory protein
MSSIYYGRHIINIFEVGIRDSLRAKTPLNVRLCILRTMESPLQTATAGELSVSEISQTPRHQQLIVTIFGLYARETGALMPVSSLVRLLGELGVEAAGVRSSVSRLKRRGILESTKAGGIASYAIVPGRVDMFTEGDTRIFSPSHPSAEDKWLLVVFSIPETMRVKRHILRSELTRMGFGSVSSGVWIAPERTWIRAKQQLDRLGLELYIDYFRAEHLSPLELSRNVGTWWDLVALDTMYADFIAKYESLKIKWDSRQGNLSAETLRDAFVDYVPMITEWRRLPYKDPGISAELLPADWKGMLAEELFGDLHRLLGTPAHDYVLGVMSQK